MLQELELVLNLLEIVKDVKNIKLSKILFVKETIKLYKKYFIFTKKIRKTNDLLLEIIFPNYNEYQESYQIVKKYQQNAGNFWQDFFCLFRNWNNLHVGHSTGLDIVNEKEKIIIELKNRNNTDNHSAKKTNISKLRIMTKKGYTSIYGIINDITDKNKEYEGYTLYSKNNLFKLIFKDDFSYDKLKNMLFIISNNSKLIQENF